MQFINTRPEQRAKELTEALQKADYEVIELPLLSLQPLPLEQALKQQYAEFDSVEYVVVVSPTAAEIGLKYYQELGYSDLKLKQKIWIAVGKATQQYLKTYDIESLIPEVETSEGMLALGVFKDLQHTSIAFWRGIGGRTFMMECLKNQGCNILNMLLYNRHLPDITVSKATLVQQGATILISSEESWNNWRYLAKTLDWDLAKFNYVVLADRVSQILKQHFLNQKEYLQILTVSTLKSEHILEQLKGILPNE